MVQRLENFDIAKAICIILVVIGHYCENAPAWYMDIHDVIYSFHMPLFMFASGYIYIAFKKEEESYTKFIWKKIRRLMIPYFVVSFIVISIKLLSQGGAYVENHVTFLSYIKALYSPEAGYYLWFIWALWWMFVITPFFKTKTNRAFLFGLAIILHFMPVFLPKEYFCLMQFQEMLIYFVFGMVCWDFKEYLPKVHWCVGLLGFICLSELDNHNLLGEYNSLVSWAVPFFGILMVMQLSTLLQDYKELVTLSFLVRCIMVVSSSLYIIYLFHTTFEGFAKAVLHKIPSFIDGQNDLLYIVGALIVVSCGLVCPILLHRYVLAKTKTTRILFDLR